MEAISAALKFCKTCVAMKFVDNDDDDDDDGVALKLTYFGLFVFVQLTDWKV